MDKAFKGSTKAQTALRHPHLVLFMVLVGGRALAGACRAWGGVN
jgi:hypothetical protein